MANQESHRLTNERHVMKTSLWIIILIVVAFISFLIGYSRPHPALPRVPITWSQSAS